MKRNLTSFELQKGYALLDVVLAVALFAITATGLMQVMQRVSETSSGFARDRLIQTQLEGLLAERRKVGIEAMTTEVFDELTNVTYRTYVEPLEVNNGEGKELRDLYKLTAEATYTDDGGDQVEKAELIIYQPEKLGTAKEQAGTDVLLFRFLRSLLRWPSSGSYRERCSPSSGRQVTPPPRFVNWTSAMRR